jgi:hypothetical protein
LSQSNTKKTIYPKPCGGVPLSGGQGVREKGRFTTDYTDFNYQLSVEAKVEVEVKVENSP